MKNTILIVEDDENINEIIKKTLNINNFNSIQAYSGTEALLYLEKYRNIDVIILDLMLPGLSGEDVLKKLKENKKNIPILVLSSKDSIDSKLSLLNGGASDYMTKPFNIDELIARINVLIRNKKYNTNIDKKLKHKDLSLDINTYTAYILDKKLNLTKSEFNILKLLLENPNQVFTKEQIYENIWDDISILSDNSINVHISNIRKKINKYTNDSYIETVWGIGFKLSK